MQVPTVVSNHLVSGLLRYFETTGRYASGINLFQKLQQQNPEVASLLSKILFMGNEEVEGVRVLYQGLKQQPMDYVMLDTQADFLLRKARTAATPEQKEERLRLALGCADRSTIAAPSEFGTWARLAEVYVAQEDWENALTILNSCPMFTYQDKDAPMMPEPKEVTLPILPETRLDEIDSEMEQRFNEQVDPSLLNLRASAYRGTFKHAYNILTEMTAKIGWDQLLKIRSNVFVMEDEYRTGGKDSSSVAEAPSKEATETSGNDASNANNANNASTDAIRRTSDEPNGASNDANDANNADDDVSDVGSDDESKILDTDAAVSPIKGDGGVEKPTTAADAGEKKAEEGAAPTSEEQLSRLNNKRLCERWLDSLFMVLYEDLRVYTIWRTQMAQYRAQSMQYKKSAEEWEILGGLAERLQHEDEAVEAYRACLGQRFSPRALAGILRALKRMTGVTQEKVSAVIRLVTWQYRWYSGFSPELLYAVRSLIEDEGGVKVGSLVQATNLPQHVLDLTHHYAALCATFHSSGTEG